MSTPQPPRRRRIAGESKPGTPAPPAKKAPKKAAKTSGRKAPEKKAPEKKAPEKKAPEKKAPEKKTAPKKAAPKKAAKKAAPTTTAATSGPTTSNAPTRPRFPAVPRRARKVTSPGHDDAPTAPLTAPPAGPPSAATRTRRRPSLALVGLVVVAVAALAFGGFFGVRGWNDWRGEDVTATHDKAAAAAASAAETIFTYRYDKLDQHLKDSKATMTPGFAKKFETISPALNDLAPQRKIQVKATTRASAPTECGSSCDADEAKILVFIDQARLADGSKDPTVFANRITMTMTKSDGRWLVDDITAL